MLTPWKESYDQPTQHIKKQRHYFANKGPSGQGYGFSSLNCGVGEDSRVSWTARRSTQSILREISPGCSLEGLMLKLKLQYFGHLMWRIDSLEKTLMLGGIGGRRRRVYNSLEEEMATHSRILAYKISWTEEPGGLHSMGSQSRTWLSTHTHIALATIIENIDLG